MDTEFFKRKVRELDNEKLLALLILRPDANQEIFEIAINEAQKRGLSIPDVAIPDKNEIIDETEKQKLVKWNWAAFLMAPLWTLANKLDKWALLIFIPGVNVIAIIYLGIKGNQLAYEKTLIKNIDDFMLFQAHWTKSAVRLILISAGISLLFLVISNIGS